MAWYPLEAGYISSPAALHNAGGCRGESASRFEELLLSLSGYGWQLPDYDNADTFVDWLVRKDLLARDPLVDAALQGQMQDRDLRTIQRRFLRATGLTQSAVRQIERARYATHLLQQGVSILDTVEQAGYFDQPHLTRSLKHFIGQTPAQIREQSRPEQMPFLYKTTPLWMNHNTSI